MKDQRSKLSSGPARFSHFAPAILLIVLLAGPAARAANGTWAVDAGGNWSTTTNWASGTVADGVDFTASFTNNITATRTVTLDSARTIGNLTFSDNGAAGSSWVLSGPNTLTLDRTSGTPTITVNTNATISKVLAGNDGLNRTGVGVLELTGANTYSGLVLPPVVSVVEPRPPDGSSRTWLRRGKS